MYIIILTMQIAFQRYKLKHMLYMFKKKKLTDSVKMAKS